ncbi:acyclic terpene utilization AtuA family protein [Salirhabdus salicampi]|uniref:acyclic terpene utilization AtuA family protein n=1 Tax=Salirhabdus salicampi TaxID=476102 RepID=UPI0020C2E8BF|nr:acyclic terpene utilization AtuA family protein [Salirhabdus salicampi]MCP8616313.1 DUF1446 domain-containing protein [Salirhabdus salicampi]
MREVRACSTSGILGYGFPEESLKRCMEEKPHFIACDAGSTDPGPYFLGSGKSFVSKDAVKRDLRLILSYAKKAEIPVIIGSAGGSGCNKGVDDFKKIVEEISHENQHHLKVAYIRSEVDKQYLSQKIDQGRVQSLGTTPPLSHNTIQHLHRSVAMMGPEPFIEALKEDVDLIIAGRATDASVFTSFPIFKGMNPATAWHAAKIIECGAATAVPKSHDCIMATIRDEEFFIETLNPEKTLPWKNVAAHTMYENVSPFHLQEPGGVLDTTASVYEQVNERTVRVTGSSFIKDPNYKVKLEGVEKVGYRTICIAGIRDPILLSQLDDYLTFIREKLHEKVSAVYGMEVSPDDYTVTFRKYGINGVMGSLEPEQGSPHEVGLLLDVIALDPDKSETIMAALRTLVLHSHFKGRLCISGNAAFPFSPPDIPMGEVYQFILNHTVEPDSPYELFPIEYVEVNPCQN